MSTPLSLHFSLEEMVASATAKALKIDNTPPDIALHNLRRLAFQLEEVRDLLGCALVISSGYRGPMLNVAVGGTKTSAHLDGRAADFVPTKGALQDAFANLAKSPIPFDQLIIERTPTAAWIHLGIARDGEKPRREALTAAGVKGAMRYRIAEG